MSEKTDKYIEDEEEKEDPVELLPYTPETLEETTRKTGLAYGAGIVLFGSVAIMLFLGLGFDYYFGSAPKGLVGGIILGAIIGFYQFFRITSQIIKKNELCFESTL